jgi:hypothetical protein
VHTLFTHSTWVAPAYWAGGQSLAVWQAPVLPLLDPVPPLLLPLPPLHEQAAYVPSDWQTCAPIVPSGHAHEMLWPVVHFDPEPLLLQAGSPIAPATAANANPNHQNVDFIGKPLLLVGPRANMKRAGRPIVQGEHRRRKPVNRVSRRSPSYTRWRALPTRDRAAR